MRNYILRRLLLAIPTIVGVTLIMALLVRALPGNIADILAAEQGYTEAEKAYLRQELGVDKPFVAYYSDWLRRAVQGDLGRSLRTKRPIAEELKQRLPVTLELGVVGLVFASMVAIPLGVLSAVRRNTPIDYVARSFAVFALATPGFWLATLVIVWAALWFNWSPPLNYRAPWEDPARNTLQIFIPAALYGLILAGTQTRMLRAMLLEVMREDYVRTAHAKGLPARLVLQRHTLRNSLIPFVTVIGIQIPVVLGGAVVFESIFSLPGMGTYLLDGLANRDYTVVQAVNVVVATIVVATNLLVDLTYVALDPRIRLG